MEIFVLGTGRSGTHWIGHILKEHPDVRATIEKERQFKLATEAAIWRSHRDRLLPQLYDIYVGEIAVSKPRHYADKSHPVMWYAETVAEWFPGARFIGIERSPFGTVASMLRHSGVSNWQRTWRKYGAPNEFLGITENNKDQYDDLDSASQAALRWLSHHRRMEELRANLGQRILILSYEKLIDDYERGLDLVWEFLDLRTVLPESQRPNQSSRDAWREELSEEQIRAITDITGVRADG